MKKATIAAGAFATVLILLALAGAYRTLKQDVDTGTATSPAATAPTAAAAEEAHPSFLYGRITTVDGVAYEGRLRWGGGEEAFWGDYFNGAKKENPWVAHVPPERLPKERRPIEIFGVEIAHRDLDCIRISRRDWDSRQPLSINRRIHCIRCVRSFNCRVDRAEIHFVSAGFLRPTVERQGIAVEIHAECLDHGEARIVNDGAARHIHRVEAVIFRLGIIRTPLQPKMSVRTKD